MFEKSLKKEEVKLIYQYLSKTQRRFLYVLCGRRRVRDVGQILER